MAKDDTPHINFRLPQTVLQHHVFFFAENGYIGLAPTISNAAVNILAFMPSAIVSFVPTPMCSNLSKDLLIGPHSIQELMYINIIMPRSRDEREITPML